MIKKLSLLFILLLIGCQSIVEEKPTIIEHTIVKGIMLEPQIISINLEDEILCRTFFLELMNECLIEGNIDHSTAGTYQITFTAIYVDREKILPLSILVLSEYYSGVAGLEGEELLLTLRNLLLSTGKTLPYGEARYILQETDVDPNNPDNVRLAFNHVSVPKEWDAGRTWEREHVFPVSRLGVNRPGNTNNNISTDLHNLMAIQRGENVRKSNKGLDLISEGEYYYIENDKGLASRIMFYMVTMYEELSLGEEVGETQMGRLSVLNLWHTQFPPDEFEINRNNVIASYQGNRNPFIDYPLFWTLINYELD